MPADPVCPEPLAVRNVGGRGSRELLCASVGIWTPTPALWGGVSQGTRSWIVGETSGAGVKVQAWEDTGEDGGG